MNDTKEDFGPLYSNEVLNRLYGDTRILLKQYKEMEYHLEDPEIKSILQKKLASLKIDLSDFEYYLFKRKIEIPEDDGEDEDDNDEESWKNK